MSTTNNLPEFETYSTSGINSLRFDNPDGSVFWFSYRTLVAFKPEAGTTIVHRNDWAQTTGKHLNAIDGGSAEAKARRLDAEAFNAAFREAFPS